MKKFVMNSLGSITEIENDDEFTMRDYFAIKIVQAMISNNKIYQMHPDEKSIVKDAYIVADYMMEAREAKNDS